MSKLKLFILAGTLALCYGTETTTGKNDSAVSNDQITYQEKYTNTDTFTIDTDNQNPYGSGSYSTNSYNFNSYNTDSYWYNNLRDTNELFRRNDKIITTNRMILDNLALSAGDASDPQKRVYSIVMSGLLMYLASEGDQSIRLDLSEPSDVMASDLATIIYQIALICSPLVEETSRYCRGRISQQECEKYLNSYIREEERYCRGFSQNVRLWRSTLDLYNDRSFQAYLYDLQLYSQKTQSDTDAVAYLDSLINGNKNREAILKLKQWFFDYDAGSYPCILGARCQTGFENGGANGGATGGSSNGVNNNGAYGGGVSNGINGQYAARPQQQVIYIVREKYHRHHKRNRKHHSSEENYRYNDDAHKENNEAGSK